MKILFLVVCLAAASQAFDAWSQFKVLLRALLYILSNKIKKKKQYANGFIPK
jgi:hypothetical protein